MVGSNTGYTLAHDSVMLHGGDPWVIFQDWAVGFTGSMLALNVCRSALGKATTMFNTAGEVVTEIGKALTEYDIGYKNAQDPSWSYGIWCILANRDGDIWDVDESLCLAPIPRERFWARGSGERYALGASKAIMDLAPVSACKDIVRRSIQAASYNDIYSPGDAFVCELG